MPNVPFEEAAAFKQSLAASLFGAVAAADTSYLAAIPPGNNVLGFAIGPKMSGSSIVVDTALIVYVRQKRALSELSLNERVPTEYEGLPTEVVPVGEIQALARPTPAGVSGGHRNLNGSGTLGCLVTRQGQGERRFILSNNHVMAQLNSASIGDDVVEPSMPDSGGTATAIATLSDFEPLRFGGPRNDIDAAVAELIDPADMTPDIKMIGRVTPASVNPVIGMSVKKYGRTTGLTLGVIAALGADVSVTYANGQTAHFEGQISVRGAAGGNFGQPGDSGSLVVDSEGKRPVGLLFAVGGPVTFCNHIRLVLPRFTAVVV
jgi:hypothetical protein